MSIVGDLSEEYAFKARRIFVDENNRESNSKSLSGFLRAYDETSAFELAKSELETMGLEENPKNLQSYVRIDYVCKCSDLPPCPSGPMNGL